LRVFFAFSVALISLAPPVVLSTFGATDASPTNKKTSAKKTYKSYKKTTATSAKTTSQVSKQKSTATTAHTTSAPPVAVASGSKKAGSKKTKPVTQAASYRRSAQQQPTRERYTEIQQAMLDKGYFAGPVDGEWGPSSVDALKRFQHDQNLTEDGKIGSVSLIALGLGPKRETPPPPTLPTPAAAPPDTPQPTAIP
jgi:peptidoglycan hydrolase-like protein with peptidoglycan-binding domain